MIDVGLASLAGFVAAAYAARVLDVSTLGAYAIFFAAFVLISVVPQQLLFQPAQVAMLRLPRTERVAAATRTLPAGVVIAVVGSLAVAGVGLIGTSEVPRQALMQLAATAVVLSVVSPLQDFVRSTMHLARRPNIAAALSAIQLTVTVLAVASLHAGGAPPAVVPFGSLAIANASSLSVGIWVSRRTAGEVEFPPLADLLRSGRVLVIAAALTPGASLISGVLVASLASVEELGYAEASRVVVMPLVVLAAGVQRTLGPRLLEAAHTRSASLFGRERRLYVWIVGGGGFVYLLAIGFPHPANPMQLLAPAAYVLGGLVALRVAVQLVQAAVAGYRPALLATGGEKEILRASLAHAIIMLVVTAALAAAIGAYAIPAAVLCAASARGLLVRGAARRRLDRP